MDWDPSFFRKSPLFWPIARAASALEKHGDWPSASELTVALEDASRMRFALSAPKPRRKREPSPPDERYDAQIVAGTVPTRARSWHDLLNALVWASFPNAKRALHARQHRIIGSLLDDEMRLPGARTKEQDAVAMLDEGGVILLVARAHREEVHRAIAMGEGPMMEAAAQAIAPWIERGAASLMVFGHGIYESLVCAGFVNVRAAGYVIDVDVLGDGRACIAAADAGVTRLLERDAPILRSDFAGIQVGETLARATAASH